MFTTSTDGRKKSSKKMNEHALSWRERELKLEDAEVEQSGLKKARFCP
jgi:hypothetical protein